VNFLFNVHGALLTEVRGARTTSVVAWCRCSLLGWRKALWNFHLYPLTRALLAYWRGLLVPGKQILGSRYSASCISPPLCVRMIAYYPNLRLLRGTRCSSSE
jgi:hypothetical protein